MNPISKILADGRSLARVSGAGTALAYFRAVAVAGPEIWRSKSLVPADRRMAGRRWPYSLQGASFELDGRFFGGAREMYCRQVYFPTAAFAFRPGTTVLDLGANVGLFSILAGLAGCKVVSVEAQFGFARELADLASSYGLSTNLIIENALIGSGAGLFSDPSALAEASHSEGHAPPLLSMSELLAKHGVDQIDFLKVDIEGSEFDLFRSADRWLGRVRRIAMEVHPQFGSVSELRRIIESNGMTVTLRDDDLRTVSELPRECGYLYAIR